MYSKLTFYYAVNILELNSLQKGKYPLPLTLGYPTIFKIFVIPNILGGFTRFFFFSDFILLFFAYKMQPLPTEATKMVKSKSLMVKF